MSPASYGTAAVEMILKKPSRADFIMELQLEHPPTPEGAPLHAQMAVDAARNISQLDLDYTPQSLAKVDQIIDGLRHDGASPQQVGESLFAFGCYVGEVFVRHANGQWRLAAETAMKDISGFPLVVELAPAKFCNPIGKVFKRLMDGNVDNLEYFYVAFTRTDDSLQSATASSDEPNTETEVAPKEQKKGLWKRLFGG
jgi:hypothetical protein